MRLEGFGIGYGDRILLSGVDTCFSPGTLTALVGRNGSGKSTLLRALAGLNPRYTGRILVGGRDIREMGMRDRARVLALVTTERTRIPNMRCEDVVGAGRAPYTGWSGALSAHDRMIVAESLGAVGMEDYAGRTMDTMSDGECQRVMIARALAQDTPVLMLDEPTSFLDMPNRYELAGLLGTLARERGKCVLFSTHELDIAMRMCDMVALVDSGRRTLLNMTPDELGRSGTLGRLFGERFARFTV